MWFRTAAFLLLGAALSASAQRPEPLKSGVEFQSPDVQALQADEFANPGMLWVSRGEAFWLEKRGEAANSCASCHGDARQSMRGIAAKYPRYVPELGKVINLEGRINACVVGKQKAKPWSWESEELLAVTAYVARQSRGMPLTATVDERSRPLFERGRALYFERQGQLHLACNQCHDNNWGRTLLSEKISQGHPADWPAYRLEWQAMGSLHRRLRACFFGVRAQLPAFGSEVLLALEVYLAHRANGLAASAPGVRR